MAALVVAPQVRDAIGSFWPFLAGFALLGLAVLLDGADLQTFDLTGFRPLIIAEEAAELLGTALLATCGVSVYLRAGET